MLLHPERLPLTHRVLVTFDDGPDALHTAAVLDELGRHGVSVIFFVVGEKLESGNRPLLERAAGEGHLIGNHGYSHRRLTQLTDAEIASEFRRTEALIGELDGGVKLWRPPFGDRDSRVDSVMASLGYTRMLWNVDSLDWREGAGATWVDHTLQRIQIRMARGFRNTVVLLHDAVASTAAQLAVLLERLEGLRGTKIGRYDPRHPDGLCLAEETGRSWPICPADAVCFRLGDSRVVARRNINAVYVLNQSAGLLWDSLAEGASEAEAAQRLAGEYGISEELTAPDVESAMADWRTRGLLGPKAPELEDPGPWSRSMDEISLSAVSDFAEEHGYRFLDLRFRIRFQSAAVVAPIHARFANLERGEAAAAESVFEVLSIRDGYGLRLPDGVVTRHPSEAALAYRLFFEIVRLAHPELEPMASLHASLAGYGDGAVALVGNNGSGKSTLAAALASSGLRVLSDDRLLLDFTTRRPAATPNAVSLKRGSWRPLVSRYPNLFGLPVVRNEGEEIRFLLTPPPTERLLPPVTHLFFPRYRAGSASDAVPITAEQAMERIAAAEGWISSEPEKLGEFLDWTEHLHCYELPFSDLDKAVERIRECLRV